MRIYVDISQANLHLERARAGYPSAVSIIHICTSVAHISSQAECSYIAVEALEDGSLDWSTRVGPTGANYYYYYRSANS